MTGEEAVAVASAWVEERYPVVPPVSGAHRVTDERVDEVLSPEVLAMNPEADHEQLRAEMERIRGKWIVGFFCSWDTDAVGMPETLNVCVDPATGEVEEM